MKRIKYDYLTSEINHGTDENPDVRRLFLHKDFPFSEEALEAAKREAYNGEYEIYDDGQPEPEAQPSEAERIAELEEALALLLSGVTE